MTCPSFVGVIPRSDCMMAFSMAATELGSKGWITRTRGSGTLIEANWFMGVGVP